MGRPLLIIDMQEVLVPMIWRGEELADRVAGLVQSAREEPDVIVVGVQQTGPPGSRFDPETPGWQLSARLGIQDNDVRVRKSATDSFFRSDLGDLLKARDVDALVIAGVATDYCVDATARSALSRGFDVDLVSDGHAPAAVGDPDAGLTPEQIITHHNAVLSRAIHPGGRLCLVPAAEVLANEPAVWRRRAGV